MVAAQTAPPRQTAARELILLAADDLAAAGNAEFSEWDLTVAAWSRDRTRFGLRGYAASYPDHKRVMMEIMGQKPHSPVQLKFIEKIRPNTYRLTPAGKTAAGRLKAPVVAPPAAARPTERPVSVRDLYETAAAYTGRPEFRRWQDNPEEPRDWPTAQLFLFLGRREAGDTVQRLSDVRDAVRAAIDWCNVQEAAFLTRGAGAGGPPIHLRELAELMDFLQALEYRFPHHLSKKEPPAAGKKKRFD